jgi:DNA end-binding protein Ku
MGAPMTTAISRFEIDEFVPKSDIDEIYVRDPYFIVPDGEVGQQAFAVIREAIRKEGMVTLGKVVFTSREHIIALEARDKGMMGITLRYPYEVRDQNEYFDGIENEKVLKDMLDLAIHIVETRKGKFEPQKFEDQYEDALKDLIRKKQKGEKIERPKEPQRSNVVNLMDALKKSVAADKGARPQAKKGKKRIDEAVSRLLPDRALSGDQRAREDQLHRSTRKPATAFGITRSMPKLATRSNKPPSSKASRSTRANTSSSIRRSSKRSRSRASGP